MLRPVIKKHFDFSAFPTVFIREAFAREEGGVWRVYAGLQDDGWQFDERNWWSEKLGAFNGNGNIQPPRTVAAGLTLEGASLESVAMDARGDYNFDPLLRVESGVALVASGSTNYAQRMDYQVARPSVWRLYSAASGELVAQADESGALGVVGDGSYLLWARCRGILESFGEWSAIKVVVGAGAFSWNGGVYPGPGSPLYSKIGNAEVVVNEANLADFVHAFDPLARIVSASCVTTRDVRRENGQMDIPAGSLLIAGVRASRGGPQTALWLLRENHSARLLAAETSFSNGICECAKTNHFASDVQQGGDGRIYILSECDCNVYDPNRSDVFNRMRPFPEETYGHPGGQTIRFPAGDVAFWTENLNAIETNDGDNWYNQLVYRSGTTNNGGIGSRWHGTNCAEVFRGKLWSVRQDTDANIEAEDATQTLESITAGRWDRVSLLTQSGFERTWQRLRRFGANLLVFGYKSVGNADFPTLHVGRERGFDEAEFEFFIRKATPASFDDGTPRMLVAARAQNDGIGVANRVVEIEEIASKLCAFWNEALGGFSFEVAQFEALGGDVAKLPAYLKWQPQSGADAGGVWVGVSAVPAAGSYLTLALVEGEIRYLGVLPYDATFWGVLCIEIDANGGVKFEIGPTCTNARCVYELLPEGTKWRHLRLRVPDAGEPLWTLQISDVNEDRRLQLLRDDIPNVWLRVDSSEAFEALESYSRLAGVGCEVFLDEPAGKWVDVMVLLPVEVLPCAMVGVGRRG